MRRSSYGVLDAYRFAVAASSVNSRDRENIALAEDAFLETHGRTIANCSHHIESFRSFLSAIERLPSPDVNTHHLFFNWPTLVERFRATAELDREYPLFDISNEAVSRRLKLADIAPNLSRSLRASAADHSAKAVWLFLRDLAPDQMNTDTVSFFLKMPDMKAASLPQALLKLGDVIAHGPETVHV